LRAKSGALLIYPLLPLPPFVTSVDAGPSLRRVRGHEADILVQYGKSLSGEHVSPETAAVFLDTFVEKGRANLEATAKLEQDIVDLERRIGKLLDKQSEKKGSAHAEVTLTLVAGEEASIELKLIYRELARSFLVSYTQSGSRQRSLLGT
jgi:hypothetical protein